MAGHINENHTAIVAEVAGGKVTCEGHSTSAEPRAWNSCFTSEVVAVPGQITLTLMLRAVIVAAIPADVPVLTANRCAVAFILAPLPAWPGPRRSRR